MLTRLVRGLQRRASANLTTVTHMQGWCRVPLPPPSPMLCDDSHAMRQLQRDAVPSVLVVDDEPAIRKVVASALAQMGCDETYLAGDAESAFELVEREHPDLVISDVKLPGMSGVELAQRIKADQA